MKKTINKITTVTLHNINVIIFLCTLISTLHSSYLDLIDQECSPCLDSMYQRYLQHSLYLHFAYQRYSQNQSKLIKNSEYEALKKYIEDDNVRMVQIFFNKFPNQLNHDGYSNLFEFVRSRDMARIIFEQKGFNINAKRGSLHELFKRKHLDLIKFLLENGAKESLKLFCLGLTPLQEASTCGHLEGVQLFLENGSPIDKEDSQGNTEFLMAVRTNKLSVMETLHAYGANINKTNNKGETALHLATSCNAFNAIKFLLEKKFPIDKEDSQGNTALLTAARNNKLSVMETLYAYGANINKTNNNGNTALHIAAFSNYLNIVIFLLANGANKIMKNKSGHTPFKLAVARGNMEIAELLI